MKISIVGNSGSGKTTLAKKLSIELDLPRMELDGLFHQANWTNPTDEEFKNMVGDFIKNQNGSGWVIDGNYQSKLGDLVLKHADVVIWFNLRKRLVIYRLIKRSITRSISRTVLWNGNRESLLNLFKLNPEKCSSLGLD